MNKLKAITVKDLVKTYGDKRAVKGITFDVDAGSTFAFLGVNGAGKSTTIDCLTTSKTFDSGYVEVAGFKVGDDNSRIREKIGVVFQQSVLDPLLTVKENLEVRASFYADRISASSRIAELSKLIDLTEFIDQRYGTLSGGQRRRVDIARALLHKPAILFLDEPTAGLDPHSRDTVWSAIETLKDQTQLTLFVTTHYLEETERADNVCIIKDGQIVTSGTPQELRSRFSFHQLRIIANDPSSMKLELGNQGYRTKEDNGVLVVLTESANSALKVLKTFEDSISDFEFRHGTMDDVFLNITSDTPLELKW